LTEIEIYLDESLNKKVDSLDLGRVEVGTTMKFTVYVKNTDKEWSIDNLKATTENAELVFDIPSIIKANEVLEAFIYWTPKIGSRKPLTTDFHISGELLIG